MTEDNDVKTYYNVHSNIQDKSIAELQLINQKDMLPFAVCTLNFLGGLNIGIIIRTACIMGAERVLVFGRRTYDKRSCVGSQNYLPVERINGMIDEDTLDIKAFWQIMKSYDYTPVFIEQGGKDITTINKADLPSGKICLVFGCEGKGVEPEILKDAKYTFEIPQRGVIRSMNVSSAASIAMWEISKLLAS